MSTGYPKTLAALRDQEDRSWAVADALVDEISTDPFGSVGRGEFVRCSEWLATQSYDAAPEYLSRMRQTAMKFPHSTSEGGRRWNVPFRLYMEAALSSNWTSDLMDQAEQGKWTLRQFSEKLTGKKWADDEITATRRVLRDPGKLAEAMEDLDSQEQAEVAKPIVQKPEVAKEVVKDKDARSSMSNAIFEDTDRRIHEAATDIPEGSFGGLLNAEQLLREIRSRTRDLRVAPIAAANRATVADSAQAAGDELIVTADLIRHPEHATVSDDELTAFMERNA